MLVESVGFVVVVVDFLFVVNIIVDWFEGIEVKFIMVCEVLCDVMVEEMCCEVNVFFMGEEVVEY